MKKLPKPGNDMKKFMALYGHVPKAGERVWVLFRHDGWCRWFNGKPCNCDPDVELNPDAKEIEQCQTAQTPNLWIFKPTKIN